MSTGVGMGRPAPTPQPAVNRGDANAIRGYRDKLRAIHKRLSDLGDSADGPVDDAMKALEGPWKDDFAGIWQQVSLDPMKYLLTWSGDQRVQTRFLQSEYQSGQASSQWQTVLDNVQGLADYLDAYAGVIDQEVADDDKRTAAVLLTLAGVAVLAVVTVATLGTTTEATAPAAGALIAWGAGVGAGTFLIMDGTDQVIQNMVANGQDFGTAVADLNWGELAAAGLEGAVFGGIAALLTVTMAPVLTAGLGTFLPAAGARVLGLTLASGVGGLVGSIDSQPVKNFYTGISTGDWSHVGQVDMGEALQAAGLSAVLGGFTGILASGAEVPGPQVAGGQGGEPVLQVTLTGPDGQAVTVPASEVVVAGPDGQVIGSVLPDGQVVLSDGQRAALPQGYRVQMTLTADTTVTMSAAGGNARVTWPEGSQFEYVPETGAGTVTVPVASGEAPSVSYSFRVSETPGGSGLTLTVGQLEAAPAPGSPNGTGLQGLAVNEVSPAGSGGDTYVLIFKPDEVRATIPGNADTVPVEFKDGAYVIQGGPSVTPGELGLGPGVNMVRITVGPDSTVTVIDQFGGSSGDAPGTPPAGPTDGPLPPGQPQGMPDGQGPGLVLTSEVSSTPGSNGTASPSTAFEDRGPAVMTMEPPASSGTDISGSEPPSAPSTPSTPSTESPMSGDRMSPTGFQQLETPQVTVSPNAGVPANGMPAAVWGAASGLAAMVSPPVPAPSSPVPSLAQVPAGTPPLSRAATDLASAQGGLPLPVGPAAPATLRTSAAQAPQTPQRPQTLRQEPAPAQVPGPVTWLPKPQGPVPPPVGALVTPPAGALVTPPAGAQVPPAGQTWVPAPSAPGPGPQPQPSKDLPPRPPSEMPLPVTTVPPLPPVEVSSTMPTEVPGLSTGSMVSQPQGWVETRFPPEFQPWPSSPKAEPPPPPLVFTADAPEPDPSRITGRGPDGETLFSGNLNQDGSVTLDDGSVGTFVKDPEAQSFADGLGLAVQPNGDGEAPAPAGAATVIDSDPNAGPTGYTIDLNGGSIQVGGRTIPIGGQRPSPAGDQPAPQTPESWTAPGGTAPGMAVTPYPGAPSPQPPADPPPAPEPEVVLTPPGWPSTAVPPAPIPYAWRPRPVWQDELSVSPLADRDPFADPLHPVGEWHGLYGNGSMFGHRWGPVFQQMNAGGGGPQQAAVQPQQPRSPQVGDLAVPPWQAVGPATPGAGLTAAGWSLEAIERELERQERHLREDKVRLTEAQATMERIRPLLEAVKLVVALEARHQQLVTEAERQLQLVHAAALRPVDTGPLAGDSDLRLREDSVNWFGLELERAVEGFQQLAQVVAEADSIQQLSSEELSLAQEVAGGSRSVQDQLLRAMRIHRWLSEHQLTQLAHGGVDAMVGGNLTMLPRRLSQRRGEVRRVTDALSMAWQRGDQQAIDHLERRLAELDIELDILLEQEAGFRAHAEVYRERAGRSRQLTRTARRLDARARRIEGALGRERDAGRRAQLANRLASLQDELRQRLQEHQELIGQVLADADRQLLQAVARARPTLVFWPLADLDALALYVQKHVDDVIGVKNLQEQIRLREGFARQLEELLRATYAVQDPDPASRAAVNLARPLAVGASLEGRVADLQRSLAAWELVGLEAVPVPPPASLLRMVPLLDQNGKQIGTEKRVERDDLVNVESPYTSDNPLTWAGAEITMRELPTTHYRVFRHTWNPYGGELPVRVFKSARYLVEMPDGSQWDVSTREAHQRVSLKSPTELARYSGSIANDAVPLPFGLGFPHAIVDKVHIKFPWAGYDVLVIPRVYLGLESGLLLPGSDDVYERVGQVEGTVDNRSAVPGDTLPVAWRFKEAFSEERLIEGNPGPRIAPQLKFDLGGGLLVVFPLYVNSLPALPFLHLPPLPLPPIQIGATGFVIQVQYTNENKGQTPVPDARHVADALRRLAEGSDTVWEMGLSREFVLSPFLSFGADLPFVPQPGLLLHLPFPLLGGFNFSGVNANYVAGVSVGQVPDLWQRLMDRIPVVGRRVRGLIDEATIAARERAGAELERLERVEAQVLAWQQEAALGPPPPPGPLEGEVFPGGVPPGTPLAPAPLAPVPLPPPLHDLFHEPALRAAVETAVAGVQNALALGDSVAEVHVAGFFDPGHVRALTAYAPGVVARALGTDAATLGDDLEGLAERLRQRPQLAAAGRDPLQPPVSADPDETVLRRSQVGRVFVQPDERVLGDPLLRSAVLHTCWGDFPGAPPEQAPAGWSEQGWADFRRAWQEAHALPGTDPGPRWHDADFQLLQAIEHVLRRMQEPRGFIVVGSRSELSTAAIDNLHRLQGEFPDVLFVTATGPASRSYAADLGWLSAGRTPAQPLRTQPLDTADTKRYSSLAVPRWQARNPDGTTDPRLLAGSWPPPAAARPSRRKGGAFMGPDAGVSR